jgi:Mn2+/Fe2+ NRAMP family transporter
MGELANPRWLAWLSWAAAGFILVLNAWLLVLLARPGT